MQTIRPTVANLPQFSGVQHVAPKVVSARSTKADAVQFKGSFGGSHSVTVKVPQRVQAQLSELSKALNIPEADLAHTAAYLVTHANDITHWQDRRLVALVPREQLKAIFPDGGKEPEYAAGSRYYSSFDISRESLKTWEKANAKALPLQRPLTQRLADITAEKTPVSFRYTETNSRGGAKIFAGLALFIPPAWPFLLMAAPKLLLTRNQEKKDLANGVALLTKAAEAIKANPDLELIALDIKPGIERTNAQTGKKEAGNPYVSGWVDEKLFANLRPSTPEAAPDNKPE